MSTPINEYIQGVEELRDFLRERIESGEGILREEMERVKAEFVKISAELMEWRRSQLTRVDERGRIVVQRGKFQGLTPAELTIVETILQGRARYKPNMVRADSWEALKEAREDFRRSMNTAAVERFMEHAYDRAVKLAGANGYNPGVHLFGRSLNNWRMELFREVRKALDSTTAGSGDELVPTLEAAELWMDVNLETKILPLFVQSPMPSSPFDIPTQLGDVDWYPTTENEQGTTTTPSTGKTTLTAYGVKAGVPFSDELEEDAIIALAPELRSNLSRNAAEVIDDMLVNADATTGANNINFDGGNLQKSTAGKAHFVLGFDGLVHLPFVDNTAVRSRAAAVLANTSYNNVLLLMGKHAAPGRRGDVVFIAPINVVLKTLTLAQVETIEKYGPRATISSGEITSIYGTPLIMSEQFLLADTTGEVRSATANNTTGRILGVNTTQWRVGFRRQITFEPDREPGKSQTTLYVSFRMAFTERTGTRSTATHTGLVYDISSVT